MHFRKDPDVKKLVASAAAVALCAAAYLPASAAVTVNGSVTVKWNTAIAATMLLTTNYSAAGAQGNGAPTIIQNVNGGSGSCTATGVGSEANLTVNYGSITPDFVQSTNCMYENGVNALVKTNSTNWTLTEALSAAPLAGTTLCALANNAGNSFPFPANGAEPVTQTVAAHTVAFIAGATCPANTLTLTAANSTAVAATAAYPAGANIGEDLELLIGSAAATGNQTETLNYQLIAN